MSRILVVAPRFPSINQPWIDTYLEQLLVNGLDFLVYSINADNGYISEKVRKHDMLSKVLPFNLNNEGVLGSLVQMLLNPVKAAQSVAIATKYSVGMKDKLSALKKLLAFTKDQQLFANISLIHSHAEHLAYDFLLLSKLLNVPLVLTFHGLPPTGIGQLSANKRSILYQTVNTVFVNTHFAKNQVVSLGCPSEKVRILPQGLPVEDFPFVVNDVSQRSKTLKIVSVGRYHRDKGQRYSLLAAKRLLQAGVSFEWRFVGVGPDIENLRRISSKLGLQNCVFFDVGLSSEQLIAIYQQSDVFVLASIDSGAGHVETQGVVLQEAQSSGCVVIATRTGGIPECINDGEDGFLVRQRSSKELFTTIKKLAELTENEWRRIQLSGKKNVDDNFSAKNIGVKMAETLRQIKI